MGAPAVDAPRTAPLPDDDVLALLQLVDERLAALAAEANKLRDLRLRVLARIRSEGTHDEHEHAA